MGARRSSARASPWHHAFSNRVTSPGVSSCIFLTEIRDHHQVVDFPIRLDGQQPAAVGGQSDRGEDPARVLFETQDLGYLARGEAEEANTRLRLVLSRDEVNAIGDHPP